MLVGLVVLEGWQVGCVGEVGRVEVTNNAPKGLRLASWPAVCLCVFVFVLFTLYHCLLSVAS